MVLQSAIPDQEVSVNECDQCGQAYEGSPLKNAVARPSEPSTWCSTVWVGPCCATPGVFFTDAEAEAHAIANGAIFWEG